MTWYLAWIKDGYSGRERVQTLARYKYRVQAIMMVVMVIVPM